MFDNMKYNDNLILITSLKNGDIRAFDYVYNKYYGKLINYVIKILHSDVAAHDIVQEAFIKLWENRTKFNISAVAYLYRSVYNSAIDHYDHKKVVANYAKIHVENIYYDKVVQRPDAEIQLVDKDLVQLFEQAKNKLPERCRLIFEMSRNEHLKNKEISQILNVSEKCVENQMTIAISRLRRDLKDVIDNQYLFLFFFGG